MTLRDRLWCWRNNVCRKHLVIRLSGGFCPDCHDERQRGRAAKLQREQKKIDREWKARRTRLEFLRFKAEKLEGGANGEM